LPEKSVRDAAAAAGFAAAAPTLRAVFAACCCLPRAFPPAFAARLRAGVLADEPDRAVEPALRLAEPDARELELLLRAVDELLLRAVDAVLLRAVDEPLREADPVLRERVPALLLRVLAAAPLRELPDPDDDFRADPPVPRPDDDRVPLPPFDSAMLSSSEALPAIRSGAGRTIACRSSLRRERDRRA
jgi:hypothetical protein